MSRSPCADNDCMNIDRAKRLLAEIPADALVVDVGGGAAPFPRADHVIDALPFDDAGRGSDGSAHRGLGATARYSREQWTRVDLCDRRPWPFADGAFDFAVCSHLLEDVRDPVWVCSELARIAKAGYIEVPSRVEEQSRGVENPTYAGYSHHRWLITRSDGGLSFRHKPHVLHSLEAAIVTDLSPGRRINPAHAVISLDWVGSFEAVEELEFDEQRVAGELCEFAVRARRLPNLTVASGAPLKARIKRHLLYRRMAGGRR
jgi:hypothetical protein